MKAEEEDRKAKEAKKAPPPAATKGGPAKPGPTARGGGAAGRGAPAVRGAPAARGRGTATTPARGKARFHKFSVCGSHCEKRSDVKLKLRIIFSLFCRNQYQTLYVLCRDSCFFGCL